MSFLKYQRHVEVEVHNPDVHLLVAAYTLAQKCTLIHLIVQGNLTRLQLFEAYLIPKTHQFLLLIIIIFYKLLLHMYCILIPEEVYTKFETSAI